MTETAPDHGERTMSAEDATQLPKWMRDDFIGERPVNLGMLADQLERRLCAAHIDHVKLQQQLTAATARAEQAEAACVEMRRELLRLSLDIVSDGTPICKECKMYIGEHTQACRIGRALASAPGKSTADELRRLREAARKVVERASDCTLDDPLSVAIGQLESVLQAAQPARAERSEL